MRFVFGDLTRQLSPGPAGIELKIWAEFAIEADGETIYRDDLFPVVEFALESQSWAKDDARLGADLVIEGRFAFRHSKGAWDVEGARVTTDILLDALERYYEALRGQVQTKFSFDLDAFAERAPRVVKEKLQ